MPTSRRLPVVTKRSAFALQPSFSVVQNRHAGWFVSNLFVNHRDETQAPPCFAPRQADRFARMVRGRTFNGDNQHAPAAVTGNEFEVPGLPVSETMLADRAEAAGLVDASEKEPETLRKLPIASGRFSSTKARAPPTWRRR